MTDYTRAIDLPEPGAETFFLQGARQAGKTTLLRKCYPDALWIDLLRADEFRRYGTRPELLRKELAKEHKSVGQRVMVSLEAKSRRTEDGIRILSATDFVASLWAGELF